MSYGGTTLDILLRWTAKHEWVIGLALGSLAAIGVAFFLFLSSKYRGDAHAYPITHA